MLVLCAARIPDFHKGVTPRTSIAPETHGVQVNGAPLAEQRKFVCPSATDRAPLERFSPHQLNSL
jgi:hypothetical protein